MNREAAGVARATGLASAPRARGSEPGPAAAAQGEREMLECSPLPVEAVLAKLGTTDKGLPPEQVEERHARFGPNEVEHARKLGFVGEIFARSKNPLVIQLFVIAAVSLWMGDARAATVVGLMVVLSVFALLSKHRKPPH